MECIVADDPAAALAGIKSLSVIDYDTEGSDDVIHIDQPGAAPAAAFVSTRTITAAAIDLAAVARKVAKID